MTDKTKSAYRRGLFALGNDPRDARIAELEQALKGNRLAVALLQHKRRRGRPKKIVAAPGAAIRPASCSWVDLAPLFRKLIPKVRADAKYQAWCKREGHRDSDKAATLFILEWLMEKEGKRRGQARKHLRTMQNLLSKKEKTIPNK